MQIISARNSRFISARIAAIRLTDVPFNARKGITWHPEAKIGKFGDMLNDSRQNLVGRFNCFDRQLLR